MIRKFRFWKIENSKNRLVSCLVDHAIFQVRSFKKSMSRGISSTMDQEIGEWVVLDWKGWGV